MTIDRPAWLRFRVTVNWVQLYKEQGGLRIREHSTQVSNELFLHQEASTIGCLPSDTEPDA